MYERLPTHELVAFNTATESENLIHDDAVAASFGFAGGLVPGVDVYAYLCRPALAIWGERFLAGARVSTRFSRPVFDGETVTIEAGIDDGGDLGATAVTAAGACATLEACLDPSPTATAPLPPAPLPDERPPASERSLAAGTALGSHDARCGPGDLAAYLDDVRDPTSPVASLGLVHPGWLLRQANRILSANVVLGPWIHVGSEIIHHSPVAVDEPLSVRGRVDHPFERKGHHFVVLDVTMVGPDRSTRCSVRHTAIYRPRRIDP